jgi:glycine dehydrogenase
VFIKLNTSFFDTILVKADAQKVKAIAEKHEVNFFYPDAETISISLNETTSIKISTKSFLFLLKQLVKKISN